ncbi:MAG: hypothetical protein E7222_05455 [Clostridiales bacterium]|nr:hypothetical protein [Clostridiales bacterium]
MSAETINKELTATMISLEQIYLDPNNPRFTSMDWDEITEDKIDSEEVQEKTCKRLEESFSVDKLMLNIETNGFLCIDRVIVKEFKNNKYVVLEGNRRICAAKLIKKKYDQNNEMVDKDVIDSLNVIDCLVYTGVESQPAWIFQGLRHIMGIHDWSAFNKAKLLVRLMDDEGLSLTQVGKKFGLTAFGAGQWVRGYYAFKRATEESDYTSEVDERLYPYCQEIFSRSNTGIREWLKWNDSEYRFEDMLHFNEFLSWLYPRDDEEVLDGVEVKGVWTQRRISKSNDIRIISYLLRESPIDFEAFRADGNLEKAYNMASTKKYINQTDPSEQAFENINACIKSLENLPFKLLKTEKQKIFSLLEKLENAIGEIKETC